MSTPHYPYHTPSHALTRAPAPPPQVYCTNQHHLVRSIQRPAPITPMPASSSSAPGASSGAPGDRGGGGGALPTAAHARASLLFGQNGYLYASWPDCIKASVVGAAAVVVVVVLVVWSDDRPSHHALI